MAYFSALGGTGGTSATITVTYSEDFYGVTITATNGTTTLTKTATSSGTLVFDVSEGGTWVVSGTVEGATYSESVDVTFEYTAPPLVALPDGSTALPVNDIQMWLKCAGIRDKTTYTTLADVLADTETFIALCADSNACDYMARSTTWASGVAADSTAMLIVGKYDYCAEALLSDSTWASAIASSTYVDYVINVKVPTMTSNTTPSGYVASASSIWASGYEAYRAFDNNASTFWNASGTSGYIQIEFPIAVNIKYVTALIQSDNKIGTYKIQGSNDGFVSDIHDLTDVLTMTSVNVSTTINDDNAYRYYRFNQLSITGGSSSCAITALQFYGRTDNANYIPLVPVMTSNTTPSGVASAGEENARAYYAFDGNPSTKWYSGSGASGTVTYIGYQFPSAVEISAWGFAGNTDSPLLAPTKVVIQKSDDGVTYTDVQTFDNLPNDGQFHMYTLDSPITTAYIRAETYKRTVSGNTYAQFSRLQFYREPTVGDVLIHSAVEDSIFYMDDGSPVALCGIPVGDTIDVDMEAFKGQTLTLVSTVAKDPDNLSNDFSMNVRITPNITEIYLMPYGALYWWGHMSDNCEELSNANGWNYGDTYQSPTYNKNDVFVRGGSNIIQGIGSKYAINGTTYNHLKYIVKSNNYYGGAGVILGALSTKGGTTWTVNESPQSISSPTLETVDISSYASNFGLFWANDNANRYGALNAFWYE